MVNMTPLIDVVFLIIVFFIMMMNFSDVLIKRVTLPKADQAVESNTNDVLKIPITVKSEDLMFVSRNKVDLTSIQATISKKAGVPKKTIIQLRGDENIPYEIIQKVMRKIALTGISRIEFSTIKEAVPPLGKDDG